MPAKVLTKVEERVCVGGGTAGVFTSVYLYDGSERVGGLKKVS